MAWPGGRDPGGFPVDVGVNLYDGAITASGSVDVIRHKELLDLVSVYIQFAVMSNHSIFKYVPPKAVDAREFVVRAFELEQKQATEVPLAGVVPPKSEELVSAHNFKTTQFAAVSQNDMRRISKMKRMEEFVRELNRFRYMNLLEQCKSSLINMIFTVMNERCGRLQSHRVLSRYRNAETRDGAMAPNFLTMYLIMVKMANAGAEGPTGISRIRTETASSKTNYGGSYNAIMVPGGFVRENQKAVRDQTTLDRNTLARVAPDYADTIAVFTGFDIVSNCEPIYGKAGEGTICPLTSMLRVPGFAAIHTRIKLRNLMGLFTVDDFLHILGGQRVQRDQRAAAAQKLRQILATVAAKNYVLVSDSDRVETARINASDAILNSNVRCLQTFVTSLTESLRALGGEAERGVRAAAEQARVAGRGEDPAIVEARAMSAMYDAASVAIGRLPADAETDNDLFLTVFLMRPNHERKASDAIAFSPPDGSTPDVREFDPGRTAAEVTARHAFLAMVRNLDQTTFEEKPNTAEETTMVMVAGGPVFPDTSQFLIVRGWLQDKTDAVFGTSKLRDQTAGYHRWADVYNDQNDNGSVLSYMTTKRFGYVDVPDVFYPGHAPQLKGVSSEIGGLTNAMLNATRDLEYAETRALLHMSAGYDRTKVPLLGKMPHEVCDDSTGNKLVAMSGCSMEGQKCKW